MRSLRTLSLGASAALALVFGIAAHADPVITAINLASIDPGANAPGSPVNYDFFGGGSQPVRLTTFTVDTSAAGSQIGDNVNYSVLNAPDGTGPFLTGAAATTSADEALIGTFYSLSASDFLVYLLTGNADPDNTTKSVGLGVNSGIPVERGTDRDAVGLNFFAEFMVTGASPTDLFQFYATSNGSDLDMIGGITFDNSTPSVPEPSSLVLLGTGVLGVAGAARRRFFKG